MTADGLAAGDRSAALARTQLRLLREVLTRHQRLDELENGFRLVLPPGVIGDETLRELRETWAQLEFEIVPGGDDDTTELRITGPPSIKPALLPLLESDPSLFEEPSRTALMLRWRARQLTSPLRVLPDFIIIGTSKGGTTALFYDLIQHPRVAAPWQKELFYFDRDYGRPHGVLRYRAQFPTVLARSLRRVVTGEASPTYLEHPGVPQRVRRLVPGVRLIAILRDPVGRAYSLYHLKKRTGAETLSLEEAIEREQRELEGELERIAADDRYFSPLLHHFAYVWGGRYADHLQRWTQVFPREQLLVLCSDDFRERRGETYGRVLDFLGLPAFALPEQVERNRSVYHPMETPIRAKLREIFRPHNERLWEFLGDDWGWNERD